MIDEYRNHVNENKEGENNQPKKQPEPPVENSPLESFVAGMAGQPAAADGQQEAGGEYRMAAPQDSKSTANTPNFVLATPESTDTKPEPAAAKADFSKEADAGPYAGAAASDAYYPPPAPKAEKKSFRNTATTIKEKRSKFNFGKAAMTLMAAVAIALVGFGGGMLAGNRVSDDLQNQLSENFSQMLAEAGGAVLYRSVQTDITNAGYQEDIGDLSVAEVTELCADSVVEIKTETTVSGWNIFGGGGSYLQEGAGSGVVITENGYILTCAHVIDGAETITVQLRNGEVYDAKIVASDAESDVAIIKIDAEGLSPAVLGSSDDLVVGEEVVAIGNPLGELGGSVTNGIISALDREVTIEGQGTFNVLQTNAAINGGNSGGGLFNMQGELIGLVNSKASSVGVEGLAFALPVDDITEVIDDLLNYGYVTSRGVKLGVTMVDIQDELTANNYRVDEFGCYILIVDNNSNASYAGLKSGDRIVSLDGTEISSADEVVEMLSTKKANDTIELVIKRNGEEISMTVTLYGAVPDSGSPAAARN